MSFDSFQFGQPLSIRDLRQLDEQARQSTLFAGQGINIDMTGGAPQFIVPPGLIRYVTAQLTGIAYQSDGVTPFLDDNGALQYTWIQVERYIDGSGFPQWHTYPCDDIRGSRNLGGGQYLNLAHEAQGGQASQPYVILWAGVNNQNNPNGADCEHVFYENDFGFAVAQSDWVMGTWRTASTSSPGTDDYVSVKRCTDMDGDNPYGGAFNVYFYKRAGGMDPAVFGPYTNYYGSQPADVIKYAFDFELNQYYCLGDPYDQQLGSLKDFSAASGQIVKVGWTPCNGTNPAGSKISAVDDMRGLYKRCIDPNGTYWKTSPGGAAIPEGVDTDFRGVSSTRNTYAIGLVVPGPEVVNGLEDAESWSGPANGGGTANDAAVKSPAFVVNTLVRYK